MCDQKEQKSKDFLNTDNFKSCFARSVAVNSQYKQTKTPGDASETNGQNTEESDCFPNRKVEPKFSKEPPVRYRKNSRSASSMDESRRYSLGSIMSRRASSNIPKRNEIPVETIYNQNKIDTLQWQLKEVQKSREMYKAVMKEVVTFLDKAHVSLEHLGHRLNRKNSVPRSKSEHYIAEKSSSSTKSQKSLIEEHLSSWNSTKNEDLHPDEIPPEKLSSEAFRLLRTTQSLINTQEPNLGSTETLSGDEPSDIAFLTQLAREFPSFDQRPHRALNLSPKLIRPDNDIRIATAFNRKLSLQLGDVRRNSEGVGKFSRSTSARNSVAESETHSLPPSVERHSQVDPLRENEGKNDGKTSSSSATTSVSSVEDESGFSSMNSFQDVGLPPVNSTGIDDVSARSVLLKSMLHSNSGYSSLNDSEHSSCFSEMTLTASPTMQRRFEKKSEQKVRGTNSSVATEGRRYSYPNQDRRSSISDGKLWQIDDSIEVSAGKKQDSYATSQVNHQRWHSTPDKQSSQQSLKVLWV